MCSPIIREKIVNYSTVNNPDKTLQIVHPCKHFVRRVVNSLFESDLVHVQQRPSIWGIGRKTILPAVLGGGAITIYIYLKRLFEKDKRIGKFQNFLISLIFSKIFAKFSYFFNKSFLIIIYFIIFLD